METNLRKARKEKMISSTDVIKKFCISKSVLSSWETGKHLPNTETLIKLADFYGVTLDYLLGRSQIIEAIKVQEKKPNKIDVELYKLMHGDPAFSLTRGWFLVNTITNAGIFEDGSTIPLEEIDDAYMHTDICRSKYGTRTIKMLTIDEIKKHEMVWVEPLCQPDSPLKQLAGAYKVYSDLGFVENSSGNRFFLSTCRGTWAAFHLGEMNNRECQDFLDFFDEAFDEGYQSGKYDAEQALWEGEIY